ncbi:hypothetical protein PCANC_06623 [Puccinia coronata f. sp. avenae]|uniref:Uncharacterized protein n=1 Tax=Puccinia coronata f. sp. avenae TaxID=200324 RepID=A0A2N5U7H6_9BASI|nr:hypothetical protein PCANC_06623 [Puccinia coronata f. sp. avenae]PLW33686.1 hypothetical protein PCASD_10292 [Puccinia coronata f. sp. avenae]
MARVAGEASEFGQGASRGADAGTAIFSPMKGSNTIHGDISMEGFHPIDHPIVHQEAADMKPALGHPDGPPPETTTKDTTISHTPTPDGTDKLASENSALRLRKFFGDKLSKLFSKMKPMRQRFDSAIAYLRKFIGNNLTKQLSKIKSIKQWVRTKPDWESSSVIQAKEMAIPDPVPGPFEIPPMRTGI